MNKGFRVVFWNVIGVAVFLSLPVLFAPGKFTYENLLVNHRTQKEFFSYCLLVVFYYVNLYYFIPRFFIPRRFKAYTIAAIISLLLVILIPAITIERNHLGNNHPPMSRFDFDRMDHGMCEHPFCKNDTTGEFCKGDSMACKQDEHCRERMHMGDGPNFRGHNGFPDGPEHRHGVGPSFFEMSHEIFLLLAIIGFSLIFVFNDQLKKAKEEKLNSELSYLKAQINPHFLFNTLNSIYSLAIQKSDLAPVSVVKLSAIMRYVTSDAQKDLVPLEKEINYVLDYIDLQKMRFGETLNLTYKVSGSWVGKQIAPLLLVPFIENAFKHGVNPEKTSNVTMQIDIRDNTLVMKVDNAILNTVKDDDYEGGLGLKNTQNRLLLAYPGRHELKITKTATDFSVYLKIDLV